MYLLKLSQLKLAKFGHIAPIYENKIALVILIED